MRRFRWCFEIEINQKQMEMRSDRSMGLREKERSNDHHRLALKSLYSIYKLIAHQHDMCEYFLPFSVSTHFTHAIDARYSLLSHLVPGDCLEFARDARASKTFENLALLVWHYRVKICECQRCIYIMMFMNHQPNQQQFASIWFMKLNSTVLFLYIKYVFMK